MKERVSPVIKKMVDGTLYIVENAVSQSAKETAYEKVKRLILKDTENYLKKAS